MTAPVGRRAVPVRAARDVGSYRVLELEDEHPPKPGQFYMLASVERWGGGDGDRPVVPRAFSHLRAAGGRLVFVLERVGPGTTRLAELEPGDRAWLLGPLGLGFTLPRDGCVPLLVGGGVGIAPVAALQDELPGAPVLMGFRDAGYAVAAELLSGPVELATDDGSAGHHGFVTDLLDARLADGTDYELFACGPPPMLEAVRARAEAAGVPAQLALEAGMACGYGACFGCAVETLNGYIRLCVDGPVVDAAALAHVGSH